MNACEFPTQHIPQRLTELDQWVCWKLSKTDSGFTKVPISPKTGYQASSIDPRDWSSFEAAMKQFQDYPILAGIGFIFTPDDCFTGIDLDVCLDESGDFTWGKEIVDYLGTYTEVSPSGRGVKLIVEGCKPPHVGCQRKGLGPNQSGQIEIYDHARFFTITGRRLSDAHAEIAAKQDELTAVCLHFWPERPEKTSPSSDPCSDSPGEIQRRAIAYLDAIPPAISGSGGHSQTYAAATALVHGFGIEPSEALTILTQHYNPRCVPPWSDKELQHKISQAATKPHDRPFGWLRDDGPIDEANDVDLSDFMVQPTVKESCVPPKAENYNTDPGHIPDRLFRVPGFVGKVMDFTLANAPYPNVGLAFCGAMALQSFLAGRKVATTGDLRTNLYLLALAGSGTGKEFPRKVNSQVLYQIGESQSIGDKFASGEGIQDALARSGRMLFQNDEMDGVLRQINLDRDNSRESIPNILLTLYTSAGDVYPLRVKANQKEAIHVDQPHLTLFGTATPQHFYESLSRRMLTNGFFARLNIIDVGRRGKGQTPGSARDLPDEILEIAKWWADFEPGEGNFLKFHPKPIRVAFTQDAERAINELRLQTETEYDKAEDAGDEAARAAWSRTCEHAKKLALIYACSENHEHPEITLDAVQWASEFALHQTRRQLYLASVHVAENPFHAECLKFKKKLDDQPGKTMPRRELMRSLKNKAADFDQIVITLVQQGDIEGVTIETKTKPAQGYRLVVAE